MGEIYSFIVLFQHITNWLGFLGVLQHSHNMCLLFGKISEIAVSRRTLKEYFIYLSYFFYPWINIFQFCNRVDDKLIGFFLYVQ